MNPTATAPTVIALNEVLAELRAHAPARLYRLSGEDRPDECIVALAEETMGEGWRYLSQPPVKLEPGVEWDAVCASNRSWAFQLHAWDALEPTLAAFDLTGELRYLDFSVAVAIDWARRYRDVGAEDSFAWYDMAIGLRAVRLAFLVDRACRTDRYALADLATLVATIDTHRQVFADDARFAAHSNHGLYFAVGQLVLSECFEWLPGMAHAREQSRERLLRMATTQFTCEGVHAEHSPDYHRMVLETLVCMYRSGALHHEMLEEMITRSDRALAAFVLPNGRIAMLGDSPGRFIDASAADRALSEEAAFLFSRGSRGTPPHSPVEVYPVSGYAVARGAWRLPEDWGNGSYLLLDAAFHSRVHKHADDQSLIWYDRGAEILVDAGRFGYLGRSANGSPEWLDGFWYSDPRRMYVESTRAHNCVEIDGRNYARRGVAPYHSAIRRTSTDGGITLFESSVRHWQTILHRRMLVYLASEWLLVVDDVGDESGEPHDLRQRFHFAPELDVRAEDSRLVTAVESSTLHVLSLSGDELIAPVRGVSEPELLGWISREDGVLEPCTTSGFRAIGVARHRFVTLFRFADVGPEVIDCRDADEGLTIVWRENGRHCLAVRAASGDDTFSIEYTINNDRSEGGTGIGPACV